MRDSLQFEAINNASVTLFIDGNKLEKFISIGHRKYKTNHIAQEFTSYKGVAESENG